MGCADCGCVIESGVRIVICSDDCCCHDVPASEQATRVRQPSDSGIEPDGIRAELEQARATFHALVQSAGEEELGQQSNGTRWTNQQLLFHIMFGHMLVRSLLILVKCFSRLPLSFSRVLARFLDVLAGPLKLVNYWGSCAGSRLYRDERMDPTAVTAVDAKAADEQLCAWLRAEAAAGRLDWRHIAVDGKTMRGAARPDGTRPHLLSAYDVSAGTVLGQAEVDGKTNEITCFVPLLQAILDGRGAVRGSDGSDGSEEDDGSGHGSAQAAAAAAAAAEEEEESGDQELVIVTADAMHTQAGHVEAMNALGVAWILTLKDNQPGLYAAADAWNWEDEPVLHATSEISRSRHEVRTIRVTSQIPDLIRERLPSTHSSRSSSGTVTPSAAGRPRTPAAPPETRRPSPARSHTARNCPARPSWPSPRSPPPRPAPPSSSNATATTGPSRTACTTAATSPSAKTPPGSAQAGPGSCSPPSATSPSASSTAPATAATPPPGAITPGTAPACAPSNCSACYPRKRSNRNTPSQTPGTDLDPSPAATGARGRPKAPGRRGLRPSDLRG